MGAAETIQAAIDKLESLKAAATRGPWEAAAGFDDERNLEYSLIAQKDFEFFDVLNAVNGDVRKASADADLVEVLHRTIDAQLAILRYIAWLEDQDLVIGTFDEPHFKLALDMARAILGEVTPDAS